MRSSSESRKKYLLLFIVKKTLLHQLHLPSVFNEAEIVSKIAAAAAVVSVRAQDRLVSLGWFGNGRM